jgi:hypothetical protein
MARDLAQRHRRADGQAIVDGADPRQRSDRGDTHERRGMKQPMLERDKEIRPAGDDPAARNRRQLQQIVEPIRALRARTRETEASRRPGAQRREDFCPA